MKIVVTGGAGFIGSNLVRRLVGEGHDVVVLDALTYAGHLSNLHDVYDRIRFVRGDVREPEAVQAALQGAVAVLHLAAESHVDRSIVSGRTFTESNVVGSQVLLELARRTPSLERFVQVSTDEVYGSLGPTGVFTETSPLAPRSPYSASKASADLIALAYFHTYGVPVIITRCTNNYGPYQHPEKLIPVAVLKALRNEDIPVYGTGENVRDWIHVEDHCGGILAALAKGHVGEVYNLGAHCERKNLDVVRAIMQGVAGTTSGITFVPDRLGHDFRYALDSSKARQELGWAPRWRFEEGLAHTIEWYQSHVDWWEPLVAAAEKDR